MVNLRGRKEKTRRAPYHSYRFRAIPVLPLCQFYHSYRFYHFITLIAFTIFTVRITFRACRFYHFNQYCRFFRPCRYYRFTIVAFSFLPNWPFRLYFRMCRFSGRDIPSGSDSHSGLRYPGMGWPDGLGSLRVGSKMLGILRLRRPR